MKVGYISRDFSGKPLIKRVYQELIRMFYYRGQEGYFEAAIDHAFNKPDYFSAKSFLKNPEKFNNNYDLIIVNYKCWKKVTDHRHVAIKKIAEKITTKSLLFVGTDRIADLPGDEVLSDFDLVYKREPFKNRSEYGLSQENQKKIKPTMLTCPTVRILKEVPFPSFFQLDIKPKTGKENYQHDVFFAGALTKENNVRPQTWRWVQSISGIDAVGGIQRDTSNDNEAPKDICFHRLSREDFLQKIKRSKINLALDGIGEFTFRHLELWHLGSFMISSPSIRDLELPIAAEEGKHYVCFDDQNDLEEKIKYYLTHEKEREEIAQAGREMFKKEYNPKKHGVNIIKEVEKLV